jgi:hypothetical protein
VVIEIFTKHPGGPLERRGLACIRWGMAVTTRSKFVTVSLLKRPRNGHLGPEVV